MRLERITFNKIKIFLTHDDLKERGMTKEDLWLDGPKVQQLFREMMLEANDELGFKVDGSVAVEVFSLPAQGMVIIVTKHDDESDFDDYEDGYVELKVTLDETDEVFFEFASFEDIIGLSSRLQPLGVTGGKLFSCENKFYMMLADDEMTSVDFDMLIALLSEFGNPATATSHRVIEYGKTLIESEAIGNVYAHFVEEK